MTAQTSYQITVNGIMHALASDSSDAERNFLLYILKYHFREPVILPEILLYFNKDKKLAYKHIFNMMKQQLLDVNEETYIPAQSINSIHKGPVLVGRINNLFSDYDFVLSDLNGLPITYNGFNQQQATHISSIASDFIKVSRRSRYEQKTGSVLKPFNINTSWYDTDIIIYLLYFGQFSCLLTIKNIDAIQQDGFIKLASHLCNRYNYD